MGAFFPMTNPLSWRFVYRDPEQDFHWPLTYDLNVRGYGTVPTVTRNMIKYQQTTEHAGSALAVNTGEICTWFAGKQVTGLPLESPETNIIAALNTDLTTASWTATNCTVAATQTDPFGGTAAHKVTYTDSGANLVLDTGVTASDSKCRLTVWLKQGAESQAYHYIKILDDNLAVIEQVALTNEWKMFMFTGDLATSVANITIEFDPNASTPLYIFLPFFSAGSSVQTISSVSTGSVVPETISVVAPSGMRADQGTYFAEIYPLAYYDKYGSSGATVYTLISPINANPASYIAIAKLGGAMGALFEDGTGPQSCTAAITAVNWAQEFNHRVAVTWTSAGVTFYKDGAVFATRNSATNVGDNPLPSGATIGLGLALAEPSAIIKNVRIWKTLIPANDLIRMTATS